ncbi:3-methylornithine--L-lysine ligase PylC [Desulforhopalus vacuolatus]|uniref:3-methylornithine--L-lysine ligase PylC n=1 Tax=Desulforhopalus vacuolatus TaxID=40414 RepID=UPI001965E16A|nr:3-methylornithine--L-lysine ligase PylC [Desulforhopalus vacuolatus]MBM9520407.1 3-methylornithine--L-lysine ligase PylC [Desulforhopalus vacuolatus]
MGGFSAQKFWCKKRLGEPQMRIAVVGGKLQGLEILYLARVAGFETLLIDKNSDLPAGELCDSFVRFHFNQQGSFPADCGQIHLIFPALEDLTTLKLISSWGDELGIPVVFDLDAYGISSSKIRSNALFEKLKLPRAKNWPDCNVPVIIKPDDSSGSKGVVRVDNRERVEALLADFSGSPVVEEYLEGPSYSIEVIGRPGNYAALPVTELYMDKDYDCCGVLAPPLLSRENEQKLRHQICTIAEALNLHGIMDLEVILHAGELKILEIDARFPSQTPIAVFHATGVNMVELLVELFVKGRIKEPRVKGGFCLLEHIRVTGSDVEILGEHILADRKNLQMKTDFYGAHTAITDFNASDNKRDSWIATLVYKGNRSEEVDLNRRKCMSQIAQITKNSG